MLSPIWRFGIGILIARITVDLPMKRVGGGSNGTAEATTQISQCNANGNGECLHRCCPTKLGKPHNRISDHGIYGRSQNKFSNRPSHNYIVSAQKTMCKKAS